MQQPSELAVLLAGLPITTAQLRFEHRDNGAGLCLGCTQPGFGAPYRPWPCSLALLAAEASEVLAHRSTAAPRAA